MKDDVDDFNNFDLGYYGNNEDSGRCCFTIAMIIAIAIIAIAILPHVLSIK